MVPGFSLSVALGSRKWLGFRIRPRSSDVISKPPSSLQQHLRRAEQQEQLCRLSSYYQNTSDVSRWLVTGRSSLLLLSFVSTFRPLKKETPMVVCIRTDTRNSTEYWPCCSKRYDSTSSNDGEIFLAQRCGGEYLCHTGVFLIRLEEVR